MTEEFLYYLWKNKLLRGDLLTDKDEIIEIIDTGRQNYDAGPDFLNAKLKINSTIWAGNVEMHINSSDWLKHNHQNDSSYDNVILHVVFENDVQIKTTTGEKIPCLEVKEKYNKSYYYKYKTLVNNRDWIPCSPYIKSVDDFIVNTYLDSLLIERLERKSKDIEQKLEAVDNNWNELFYRVLARSFGFKKNSTPFELLAKSLKYEILLKHKDNLFQIEALLFGQSGLLNKDVDDEYTQKLISEYTHLSNKYGLTPMPGEIWKALRMRPVNFPTIRIAQFAKLIYNSKHIFSKLIELKNIDGIRKLFVSEPSEYWQNHYVFGKKTKSKTKKLGKDAFELILINTISPVLFVYYKKMGVEDLRERALKFLYETKAEKNAIISRWNKLGIKADSAAQTQALLTLKEDYCTKKRCLDCRIGHNLINK